MSIYRINPIGGGSGFKVNVSDKTGGLRVIGIFSSETAAAAWISADRDTAKINARAALAMMQPTERT